jgi:tetratricopeptide (TPR) repeat protein
MHPFQKNIILPLALLLGLSFQACQQIGSKNNVENTQTQAIENLPKLLDRPEALRYGNEWDAVQNAYGKARQQLMADPQAKEPRLDLAEIFIQEARVTGEHPHYYPAALQVLDELLAMPFDEKNIHDADLKFRALSDKASVQLSLHDFAAALETGNQAVAMNPHNAAIYGVLVDANVELGRYEEAVKMADKMVAIRPDLRSYSRVSYLREIHGDLPGAIEAMKMAVTAGYPGTDQTSWALLTLGKLYEKQGEWKGAETQYLTILDERPDYPFALGALGELELDKKNYAKAEEFLSRAAEIIPEVGFYEGLAKVYKATGRQAEFEKTFDEIIAMMEDDEAHGHNMSLEFAHAYADLKGDYKTALEYTLKEYAKRPENIDVNGMLAEFYHKTGEPAKAEMHLKKALRTGSQNAGWLAIQEEVK